MVKKTRIGILGIGAIGSVIASLLHQTAAYKLHYYHHSIKKNIKISVDNKTITIPIRTETSVDSAPDLDWLLICLKEHHYATATHWFEKLIGPKTNVAIIRNGINLKEPLLPFTPEENMVECMIDCPVQPGENGYYRQLKKPIITVPANALAITFQSLFDAHQCQVTISSTFKTESWKKLCESATLGAILCLSGETCWIFKDKKLQLLYQNILRETVQVAIADGANIEENTFIDEMLTKLLRYPNNKGSSMLTDRLNGKPIELGAKNGIIAKLATQYHLKTPLNDLITILLTHTNFGNS
jgi:2-dehydropantoate 2-reductase